MLRVERNVVADKELRPREIKRLAKVAQMVGTEPVNIQAY